VYTSGCATRRPADAWDDRLRSTTSAAQEVAQLSARIELTRDGITIALTLPLSIGEDRAPKQLALTRFVPMRMKRRGIEMRLVLHDSAPPSRVDHPLLTAVARGYRWAEELLSGQVQSVRDIAHREGLSAGYVWRVLRLGFLAPKIVEAIVEGRHPEVLSASSLTQRIDLPVLWGAQERALGHR
jgi:site-specific DNA recombinase